jgi:hypothetical protein
MPLSILKYTNLMMPMLLEIIKGITLLFFIPEIFKEKVKF